MPAAVLWEYSAITRGDPEQKSEPLTRLRKGHRRSHRAAQPDTDEDMPDDLHAA